MKDDILVVEPSKILQTNKSNTSSQSLTSTSIFKTSRPKCPLDTFLTPNPEDIVKHKKCQFRKEMDAAKKNERKVYSSVQ
ncbi:hypothetical protein KFK09_017948 [Dendrobium nobile]|uniref:Uncharacterized protein n=1 Tax=Dendrobium nobile TaxID=94219 RepID=A0A8T3AUD1_DENNO|nr:hypothetical protein KFK09_017948 [Dendrobium nobile]